MITETQEEQDQMLEDAKDQISEGQYSEECDAGNCTECTGCLDTCHTDQSKKVDPEPESIYDDQDDEQ